MLFSFSVVVFTVFGGFFWFVLLLLLFLNNFHIFHSLTKLITGIPQVTFQTPVISSGLRCADGKIVHFDIFH